VLCAHIDSKDNTPGALDNAAGVVVLLLLAELLKDYDGQLCVEIVALNGEDYYSSPGEVHYLTSNTGKFNEVLLNINIDGAGYYWGDTAYSLYDCPDEIAASIRKTFAAHAGIVAGEQWYQSDHMLFVQNRAPALAITSERVMEFLPHIPHTPKDKPELVDCSKLAAVALALQELLLDLNKLLS
jgi:aminopeptidase YwaD